MTAHLSGASWVPPYLSPGFLGMNMCLQSWRPFLVASGLPRLRNMGARQGGVGGSLLNLGRAHQRESFLGDSAWVTVPFGVAVGGKETRGVCSLQEKYVVTGGA